MNIAAARARPRAPIRLGRLVFDLSDHRLLAADAAVVAAVLSVVGLFAISPVTLEAHGVAYLTSGGGLLSKVHPSTLLALAALGLRSLSSRRPLRAGWRLATNDAGVILMVTAVLIAAIYATMISHTPMTPLIDTYALPVLVFLLLRDLDPRILRWLGLLIGLVICANAVIAILEYHRHFHLVSIDVPEGATSDPRRGDATFDWRAQLANDWRATALLGHPLTNGLITGAFIICLCARGSRWIPVAIKIPIVLLQATALLAFGARTALVLTMVCSAWVGLQRCLGALRTGARIEPRHLAIVLIGLGAAAAIGAILFASGFGDQTIQRFQQDQGSAETRITMFKLFDPLSFSDMLLGPDPDVVATDQRLEGLEFGIESSWISLALTYGLVVTGILVTGLAAFVWSVLKASGPAAGAVLVFFFIQVSVSASMSTKTTIFALTIALVQIFLQKDAARRRVPTPAAPDRPKAWH